MDLSELLRSIPSPTVENQPLYEALHAWALRGMNIGGGDYVRTSGERAVLEHVAKQRPNPVIVDVGAHEGEYARLALEVIPEAEIHCFEPSHLAFRRLSRSMDGKPKIFLRQMALGNRNVITTLYEDVPGSGMGSLYPRRLEHFGRAMRVTSEVSVDTLDNRSEIPDRIHLLKLDVEGHELRVLEGAQGRLAAGGIDLIQFEGGGTWLDSRTNLQDFFYCLGPRYRIHRVVRDGFVPIQYAERYEVFSTTNYVAILT